MAFNKQAGKWRIECKLCRIDNQRVDNARRHLNSAKHTEKINAYRRLNHSEPSNSTPVIPIESVSDLVSTRLLAYLSNDPHGTLQNLPALDTFLESSTPAYEPLQNYNWDELSDLDPHFVGSREAEEIQALSDYMLGVYQFGPDNINSDEEFHNETSDSSESETDDSNPFDRSRGKLTELAVSPNC